MCSNAQKAALRSYGACTTRNSACTGRPTWPVKEASRERDGGCFVIQCSAPAHPPRTSCPLKLVRRLYDIYAFSAAQIWQRKLRCDAALGVKPDQHAPASASDASPLCAVANAGQRSLWDARLTRRGRALCRRAGHFVSFICNAPKRPFPRASWPSQVPRRTRSMRWWSGCPPH
jgi:hypothetical protein